MIKMLSKVLSEDFELSEEFEDFLDKPFTFENA